jgi:hypothetical protein
VEAISGRFDRNPPLHYEMRIRRVRGELAESPDDLALHDDIAVAFDRLGKSDEALKWIERKRRRMTGMKQGDPYVREHWYRYYANVGTFRAHQWLRDGADRKHRAPMLRAGSPHRRPPWTSRSI